uniref:Uncharacterized protein n=1 Tax=Anguilla anguilla TaxID=7936 RepID=A0A0E9TME5_ANGAN
MLSRTVYVHGSKKNQFLHFKYQLHEL